MNIQTSDVLQVIFLAPHRDNDGRLGAWWEGLSMTPDIVECPLPGPGQERRELVLGLVWCTILRGEGCWSVARYPSMQECP